MGIALYNRPYLSVTQRLLRGFLLILGGFWASLAVAQPSLQLPFFDDFSTPTSVSGSTQPDTTRWKRQPLSGVYINNTMAINQPTVNVATFDGLKANGRPYVINNPLEQGYTDTLESKPINMAGLSVSSGVYMSFYWQSKGLGELPDPGDTLSTPSGSLPILQPGDSLTLQFQDSGGSWKTVWAQAGGQADSVFHQAFVQVTDPRYFYDKFAFRFRSFGRRSGPFDTWHVDYIYLNKGRSANDKFVQDVAARQALSPLLKRYTAMPLTQYKLKAAAETADSVTTDINNLFDNFNFTTFHFTIRDEVSGRVVQDNAQTNSTLVAKLSSQRKAAKPTPITDFGMATKAQLRYKFDVLTTDNQNPSIPGVDLRQNDSISAVAVLDDYYAYDDGSWEYAQQIRQREQVAVRFALNKPDAISGVRACIVPFTTNQTGQSFVLKVYANTRVLKPNAKTNTPQDSMSIPGAVIYQQSFPMQYPDTRNGFVEFKFTSSVSVKDTFYVGYQQISSSDTTFLRLGFDKNSPFGEHIFYNGGSNWEQNLQKVEPGKTASSLQVKGAFMIRPVMGAKPAVVTATTEPEPLVPLRTYPNPTSGLIHWDNSKLTRLEVLNSSGQGMLTLEPSRGQQTLDLSYLPDGLYLIRLFAEQRVVVQKLIIQH